MLVLKRMLVLTTYNECFFASSLPFSWFVFYFNQRGLDSLIQALSSFENWVPLWKLSTTQAGARGREGCFAFSLSLIYRRNRTESAIFM
jgi:hypothetical protein